MSTPTTEKRTEARKKISNEIFTPTASVKQMLDGIERHSPELFNDPSKRILEPACGNGRFLTAIVNRRLEHMSPHDAIKNLFALDIHPDNVSESRQAILDTIKSKMADKPYMKDWSRNKSRLEDVLKFNIVCGDSSKILGNKEYHENYKFDIEQPDPYEFNIEDEIDNRPKGLEKLYK